MPAPALSSLVTSSARMEPLLLNAVNRPTSQCSRAEHRLALGTVAATVQGAQNDTFRLGLFYQGSSSSRPRIPKLELVAQTLLDVRWNLSSSIFRAAKSFRRPAPKLGSSRPNVKNCIAPLPLQFSSNSPIPLKSLLIWTLILLRPRNGSIGRHGALHGLAEMDHFEIASDHPSSPRLAHQSHCKLVTEVFDRDLQREACPLRYVPCNVETSKPNKNAHSAFNVLC